MIRHSWYEVRTRECIEPGRSTNGSWIDGKYVKKSKFYFAKTPQDAASRYKGKGHIISVEKVGREKLLGIGDFFKLGDILLREFKQQGGELLAQVEGNKDRRRQRRNYNESLRRR